MLVLPAAQVPPFGIEQEWIDNIDGHGLETYIDWMAVCCMITVTSLPTLSVPGGFSPDGLPIGVQIVGPQYGDLITVGVAQKLESMGFVFEAPAAYR